MKFLFDLLPVIIFFAGYSSGLVFPEYGLNKPIEFATALAIAASVIQIGWLKLRGKPIEVMQWIGLGLIVVLGGLTLVLHSPAFIYWKPTAVNLALAGGLLITRFVLKKPPMALLLGKEMKLPEAMWDKLMWAWVGFFLLLAVVNLVVAFNFPEDIWVKFKLFGVLGMTFVFAIAQGLWLARHLPEDTAAKES
ncbi:septation protein A [Chitinimonas sp. BJYL2]|uniref:septation protein A n=1 Tax=Chitinimonas sp. BJYL2 TaxID=2976696 RepID=UPI0022B3C8E3|nr:septation protein A [Chitinimonas sp. BJYL2]